jgi:hypothetical protein
MTFGVLALAVSVAAAGQVRKEQGAGIVEMPPRGGVTVVSYSAGCRGTTLQAEFEYGAAGARSVESIRLGFNGIDPEGPRLRIEADGRIFDLGRVTRIAFVANRPCRNLAIAHGVRVDRIEFLRVMKAKTIVMKIGAKKMDLSTADVEALRALAKRLQPGP